MEEFEHIKRTSESAQTTPPSRIWENVSRRLDIDASETILRKRKNRRVFSIAAACIAIFCVSTMIYIESNNSTEKPMGHIAGWEELETNDGSIYDIQKLHGLYQAYSGRQVSNNPI